MSLEDVKNVALVMLVSAVCLGTGCVTNPPERSANSESSEAREAYLAAHPEIPDPLAESVRAGTWTIGQMESWRSQNEPQLLRDAESRRRDEAAKVKRQADEEKWQRERASYAARLDVPAEMRMAIAEHRLLIGMTKAQVLLSWRPPYHINHTVTGSGSMEQWVYGQSYLYFEAGVLKSFQSTSAP